MPEQGCLHSKGGGSTFRGRGLHPGGGVCLQEVWQTPPTAPATTRKAGGTHLTGMCVLLLFINQLAHLFLIKY